MSVYTEPATHFFYQVSPGVYLTVLVFGLFTQVILLTAVWLTLIVMVGRHWYVLCEEIITYQYPQIHRFSLRQRMTTMSIFSRYKRPDDMNRASRFSKQTDSTRMPVVIERMEGKMVET